MANTFFRAGRCIKRIVNTFRRPAILQLNIEGLTASKMSVLYHLAAQCKALVILLQKTHCTSAERLILSSYQLAGFSLSRKFSLATFVHERLKWTLFDQFPSTLETERMCVDVDGYKMGQHLQTSTDSLASFRSPTIPTSLSLC